MSGIDAVRLNFSPESLMLLNAILSIVMFSIALDLRLSDFRALMRAPKALITGLVSQFLVLPALTFAMLSVTNPQPSIALGLILVAACPGGNISNFITHRAGGNAALSVSMTGIATVAAILFTPLNVAFWGSLYAPTRDLLRQTTLDPVSIAITVFFMLILPLILGIVLNAQKPELAARIRKPMQSLSMVIFIGFIVLALAANWSFFLGYVAAVAGLVVLHNALALSGGYATATLMRLSDYDRRAITIETGIQNSGLGLVLIFAFFGGLGGMAVAAAFWGIWHAISGLVLASLWSRSEARR
ncbi:MAG: bile acid:sodium symporter family protein [Hoeflea sp.]|uniref:bile acid:sodium symporter family protein n=1 Tax=Hoeflea sp. TaxID=1940281 RepID=UPI001D9D1FB4|nr:bile acid:sodium symporter family protein [Hoeflea sp.]MBU4528830.1 bile acid:sodium symporter family protein [Alphaproteobacteria bacterium]MBU4545843.1 bile acid:sodium symporter family protein [Alphaproteobacteria bacterium]MBU4549964.1 bile acid:sodium symporter family protein [Alphaproteobacteria bacterium]MBV1725961.1 bile acid:sodium symporter family protein [Hoeflea sp.]MBV1762686.1 bile acid:sodium symporter family protein [Hoeflea sp.]